MILKRTTEMIQQKSWDEFRKSGLLWFINTILHTFGWAIMFELDNGNIVDVYPSRVKYRGFTEEMNSNGYIQLSKYLKENIDDLVKESED